MAKTERVKLVKKPERAATQAETDRAPTHGDNGGPLVSMLLTYEDGTAIRFSHNARATLRLFKKLDRKQFRAGPKTPVPSA